MKIPIIQSVTQLLNPEHFTFHKSVCPIYGATIQGEPELIGSGFLLKVSTEHFLLTAAHVLDHNKETTLYWAGNNSLIELISEESFRSVEPPTGRNDDKQDIAFIKLSVQYINESNNYTFLPIESIECNDIADIKKFYCYIGYPCTKSDIVYNTQRIKSLIYSYSHHSVKKPVYESLGYSPTSHIVIPFDKERVKSSGGQIQTFPDPWGMSGGIVIRLVDFTKISSKSFSPVVVGIAMEYHEKSKVLVSTNIAFVIESLRARYPDLNEYLPQCHTMKINLTQE